MTGPPPEVVVEGVIERDAPLRVGPGTNLYMIAIGQRGKTVGIVHQSADGAWYEVEVSRNVYA